MSLLPRAVAPATAFALLPLLAACSGAGSSFSPSPVSGASVASRAVAPQSAMAKTKYTFQTLDNQTDPTFNQLLGINDSNVIAGYYGIGSKQHPNKGYILSSPYGQANYTNENFPGSVMTQVTGINNAGDTSGFWVDKKGNNFGFTDVNGTFTSYSDPASSTFNQLLGINDHGLAVGFYTDASGMSHGYVLTLNSNTYTEIVPPSGNNLTATGIDNQNDVTGFYTDAEGVVEGFLYKMHTFTSFSVPNATATNAFGINEKDEIVGAYTDAAMNSHGFTVTNLLKKPVYTTVDDPSGIGTTVINGINTNGDLVGFYSVGKIVHGFLATK